MEENLIKQISINESLESILKCGDCAIVSNRIVGMNIPNIVGVISVMTDHNTHWLNNTKIINRYHTANLVKFENDEEFYIFDATIKQFDNTFDKNLMPLQEWVNYLEAIFLIAIDKDGQLMYDKNILLPFYNSISKIENKGHLRIGYCTTLSSYKEPIITDNNKEYTLYPIFPYLIEGTPSVDKGFIKSESGKYLIVNKCLVKCTNPNYNSNDVIQLILKEMKHDII